MKGKIAVIIASFLSLRIVIAAGSFAYYNQNISEFDNHLECENEHPVAKGVFDAGGKR